MNFLRRLANDLRARWPARFPAALLLALLVVPMAGLLVPQAANACPPVRECIASIFAWIFQILTSLMGHILILEVDGLIRVAQFSNFVSPGPTAVQIGWIVTRDLANMFFILILLVIAFDTIIRGSSGKYHWRSNLLPLLVTAVVINFSKTLCGLLIDLSQVIMLTFVNGFKEAAAGNFLSAFQIQKILSLDRGAPDIGLVMGMMLAFILVTIACSVVLIMLIMMVFRFVSLWVLVILAPIAWLTRNLPGMNDTYTRWWGDFKKNLTAGPKIAFFLWLALATVQGSNGNISNSVGLTGETGTASSAAQIDVNQSTQNAGIPTEAGRTDAILSLIIVTCILFIGLKEAQAEAAATRAGFANDVFKWVRGKAMSGAKVLRDELAYRPAAAVASRVGGAMATGTMARIPILGRVFGGAGAALAVRGQRVGAELEDKRKKRREMLFGNATEAARMSGGKLDTAATGALARIPGAGAIFRGAAGSRFAQLLARETDPDKKAQMMKDVLGDKKAAKALADDKTASAKVLEEMDKLRRAKPSQNGLYQDALRKFWKNGTPAQQKEAWSAFKAEDADGLKEADFANPDNVAAISPAALEQIQKNGTPEQKTGLGNYLRSLSRQKLADFYKRKRISETDITTSMMREVPRAIDFVLDGINDSRTRREVMADGDKAGFIRSAMTTRLNEIAHPPAGAVPMTRAAISQTAVDALSIGMLSEADFRGNPNLMDAVERALDVKALSSQVDRESNDQIDAAQAMMDVFLSNPANAGRRNKILTNENYQHIIPPRWLAGGPGPAGPAGPAGGGAAPGGPAPAGGGGGPAPAGPAGGGPRGPRGGGPAPAPRGGAPRGGGPAAPRGGGPAPAGPAGGGAPAGPAPAGGGGGPAPAGPARGGPRGPAVP